MALPHFALGKDEVFQINGFPGLLQVLQHGGKQLLANGVVGHLGVLLKRVRAAFADVAGRGAHTGVLGLQRGDGRLIGGGEKRLQRRAGLGQGAAHPAGGLLVAQGQVQQPAEQGSQRDENDPQQLVGGVFVPLDQKQNGQQAQQAEQGRQPGGVLREAKQLQQQPAELHQNEQAGHNQTAGEDLDELFHETPFLPEGKRADRTAF